MKKRIRLVVLLALVMGGLTVSSLAYGQDSDEANELHGLVHKNEAQIAKWERTARVMVVITVVVGILGVIAGALQVSQQKWCKTATIFVGLAVSGMTVVLNTAFPKDYRELYSLADTGRKLLEGLDVMITRGIPKDEGSRKGWFEDFQRRLDQFLDLGKEIHRTAARLETLPTVYAQSSGRKPDWVFKLPDDRTSLYFLGVGDDPLLGKAREVSHDNALHRAVEYFSRQFQGIQQTKQVSLDPAALSEYVVKSAEEAGTYFEYDPASRSYLYYTLLRIHKDIAEANLKLYGLQKRITVPEKLNAVVQTAPGLATVYSATPFPYALGEYRIAQYHVASVIMEKGKLGIYVDNIPPAKPAQVLIFEASRFPSMSEKRRTSYSQVKRTLKPPEILLDKMILNHERDRLELAGQQLVVEFEYFWPALGQSYAQVTLKSSTR